MLDKKDEKKGKTAKADKQILIIAPASLLENWCKEFKMWGEFAVVKFKGGNKAKIIDSLKKKDFEILLVSYDSYRSNADLINSVEWDCAVCDEVHKIKDMKSKISKALNALKTLRRIGLTGTVMQNKLSELWVILNWCQPGVLGTLQDMQANYIRPIKSGHRLDASKRDVANSKLAAARLSRKIKAEIVLRRDKKVIQSILPKKEDIIVFWLFSLFKISFFNFTKKKSSRGSPESSV